MAPRMERVGAQRLEPKAEIVVEAVRRHGRLPAVEGLLVHLEGAGQVLRVAHQHDRNVADEHRALDRGFAPGVKPSQYVTQ